MAQIQVLTMWIAMALYAGATVLYAYFFLEKRRVFSVYATILTGAGFLCQTASIGLKSRLTGGTELGGANSLVLAAWAIVAVYFVVEYLFKIKVYGTVLVPLALLALLVAQLLGLRGAVVPISAEDAALIDNWRVGVHVALIVFANAGFAIGAVASATYLILEKQLKRHNTSTLFRRLPSLAQTDVIARRAVIWAYPVYTAGLMLGVLRAIETDVSAWFFDLRVILAGIVWLIFGVYLYLHYGRDASGRTTAVVALIGIAFVIALSFVARLLPVGFHVFGVTNP